MGGPARAARICGREGLAPPALPPQRQVSAVTASPFRKWSCLTKPSLLFIFKTSLRRVRGLRDRTAYRLSEKRRGGQATHAEHLPRTRHSAKHVM